MAKSISTLEAVKTVNALGHYCSEDQEALLKVIEDYFDPDLSSDECDPSE